MTIKSYISYHNINTPNYGWKAFKTNEGAMAHQKLFKPEARGGVVPSNDIEPHVSYNLESGLMFDEVLKGQLQRLRLKLTTS